MTEIVHQWQVSPRLKRLIKKHGGLPDLALLETRQIVQEWSTHFLEDLPALGLSSRTRTPIRRAVSEYGAGWEYDPATKRYVKTTAWPYFDHSDAFKISGELLSFRDWCRAVERGEVAESDLHLIPGFGPKCMAELLDAIHKLNPVDSANPLA